MKIFLYELKYYRKNLVLWCLGMIILIFLSMIEYNVYSGVDKSATDLFSQLPQSIQTVFGMNGFDFTQASGFFGILFMYITLMATIHASMLGAGIIAKEERDKTSEFLFTKPISRFKVITSKLSAGLINIIIFNIVTLTSSIFIVQYFTKNNSTDSYIILLMSGLMVIQTIFFFIGTAIASLVNKPKTAGSISTGLLLGTFVLTYLINLNNSFNNLKYLTPFKYFDALDLLNNSRLDNLYIAISFFLIITCITITYLSFNNKDLK